MAKQTERTRWVSYLRVCTVEQAEKELSLTAQRRSAEEFAAHHDAVIDHHYVEPGASGTDTHRAVFNELLGDALRCAQRHEIRCRNAVNQRVTACLRRNLVVGQTRSR